MRSPLVVAELQGLAPQLGGMDAAISVTLPLTEAFAALAKWLFHLRKQVCAV